MTRQALLVASPNAGNQALPGARLDVENIKEYLLSTTGGAWEESEISTVLDPTKAQLDTALNKLRYVDYAFITFSGHGFHSVGRSQSETRICLTRTEECSVQDINPRNNRHFVVIDACRAIVRIQLNEERSMNFSRANAMKYASRQDIRAAFDAAVMAAEMGRVVAYSCGINQSAGEDSTFGGVFSSELVSEASRWSISANPRAILHVPEAFRLAEAATYRKNAPQRPEIELGRRMYHFPFALGT